jgi:hypothetical protein
LSIAVASAAGAASIIGGGPPGPGLGGDDGTELYVPNLNPNYNRHIVLVKEAFDAVSTSVPHTWGFYFAGDTSNRYPVFTSGDQANPEQVAGSTSTTGRSSTSMRSRSKRSSRRRSPTSVSISRSSFRAAPRC